MSKAKNNNTIPQVQRELYELLVNNIDGIERKGATMPYTSVNGHMFSFLDKEGSLGLRLPEDARTAFLKKYNTKLCEAHGTVLKEYTAVPDKLFKNTKELLPYFQLSYDYVSSLKPKPTKKPATKKGK